MTDVLRHWPALLADHTAIRDRLVRAYDDPSRSYHDLRHLAEVLDRVELLLGEDGMNTMDRDAVVLAAWFHDVVYDRHGDNEERSAVLAARELATVDVPPLLVEEVARLVRLTADHRPDDVDLAGQVLCDADLAILAADRERYDEYVRGVREEYAHVDDADFRSGRAAVLRALTDAPSIFRTAPARERWEEAARVNLARELASLEEPQQPEAPGDPAS